MQTCTGISVSCYKWSRNPLHYRFDKTWWWYICSDLTENSEGDKHQHENDWYHDESIYHLLDE